MIKCNSKNGDGRCVCNMDAQQSLGGTITCDFAEEYNFDKDEILRECDMAELEDGEDAKMLDVKNATEVIKELSESPFLCSDKMMVTNNYIIIKKTAEITTDSIMKRLECSNDWIACSDRLPDEDAIECYIVCVSGNYEGEILDHKVLTGANYYDKGKWYIDGSYEKDIEVLYWMSIPKAPIRKE